MTGTQGPAPHALRDPAPDTPFARVVSQFAGQDDTPPPPAPPPPAPPPPAPAPPGVEDFTRLPNGQYLPPEPPAGTPPGHQPRDEHGRFTTRPDEDYARPAGETPAPPPWEGGTPAPPESQAGETPAPPTPAPPGTPQAAQGAPSPEQIAAARAQLFGFQAVPPAPPAPPAPGTVPPPFGMATAGAQQAPQHTGPVAGPAPGIPDEQKRAIIETLGEEVQPLIEALDRQAQWIASIQQERQAAEQTRRTVEHFHQTMERSGLGDRTEPVLTLAAQYQDRMRAYGVAIPDQAALQWAFDQTIAAQGDRRQGAQQTTPPPQSLEPDRDGLTDRIRSRHRGMDVMPVGGGRGADTSESRMMAQVRSFIQSAQGPR